MGRAQVWVRSNAVRIRGPCACREALMAVIYTSVDHKCVSARALVPGDELMRRRGIEALRDALEMRHLHSVGRRVESVKKSPLVGFILVALIIKSL